MAAGCSQARPEPELQVVNILNAQADAWNHGDLDAFLAHYWKSDDLTFSSGAAIAEGWSAVAAAYRERWPAPEQRRRLTYDLIRLYPLSRDAILVIGRWSLEADPGMLLGTFSRVFRCIAGRWVIAHEHLSPPLP